MKSDRGTAHKNVYDCFDWLYLRTNGDAGDWRIVILLVKKIGNTLVGFTANYQRMASGAFVIKKGKYIDVHMKLIFVQMDSYLKLGEEERKDGGAETSSL